MSSKIEFNSYGNTTDGTNYCSGMETLAENMIEDNENDATIVYPGRNEWITQRTEEYIIDDKSLRIILPSDIYKLKKVYIKAKDENLLTVSAYPLQTYINDNGEFIEYIDITDYIVSEKEYETLKSYGYNNFTENIKTKENTSTYSGDKIDVSGSYKIQFQASNGLIWQNIVLGALYNKYGLNYKNEGVTLKYYLDQGPNSFTKALKDLKFRVEYVPISTKTKLRARKSAKTAQEYMQPYNQRAEVNSASAFGKSMYLSAQKTGVEEITVVKTVKHINEILPLGCLVKHEGKQYIISGRNIQVTNTVTAKVTYTLSQNWTNKSKHVAVDQKYRNYNIPQDIVWRNLYWEDFIEVTTDGAVKGVEPGGIGNSNSPSGILATIFRFSNGNDYTVSNLFMSCYGAYGKSVTVPCSTMGVANSLVFTASMKDNLSAGLRISASNAEYCDEVYYCKENGTIQNNFLQIKLSDYIKQAMEKSGTVTMYGVTFNSDDVETLYRYMKS